MSQQIHNPLVGIIKEKLSEYISGCCAYNEIHWYDLERYANTLLQDEVDAQELHLALQPFYLEFIYGRNNSLYAKPGCHSLINKCINSYEGLGGWFATEGNLMDMLDDLAVSHVTAHSIFVRLSMLLAGGYRTHVKDFDIDLLLDEITRQQVEKELYRGEYLCILHAYMMIEGADITDEQKDDMEELVRRNWSFLRNVYSIMVGSVIGTKQKTFTSVCNNVKMLVDAHPYLHLFMGAIVAREESIMPNDKERQKMDKHFMYLEDIITQTPQEDTLDELCKILFGEEFEKALAKKQYASYRELEGLVLHWQKMATEMGEQLKEIEPLKAMCQSMMEALKNAIPIEEICNAILGFDDPKVSEFVFYKLDWDLEDNAAWASKRKEMKHLIKAKLIGPEQYRAEMMRIAEETKDAVKNQRPSIIGQMNLGNGTQQLPSEFTKALENLGGQG